MCHWGAVPDELHHGRRLVTLVTAVFVHAGWLHLLVNVVFLVAFAPRVEEDLGHLGLLALFLGSAGRRDAVHVLVVPDLVAPSVGASGALAGVLGAHLLLAPRARLRVLVGPVPVRLPTWFVIGLWVLAAARHTAVGCAGRSTRSASPTTPTPPASSAACAAWSSPVAPRAAAVAPGAARSLLATRGPAAVVSASRPRQPPPRHLRPRRPRRPRSRRSRGPSEPIYRLAAARAASAGRPAPCR